ncbi:immunity 42 family protein [Paenibacillus sonchi]|uniref:immunity 42 family protein n=1 Tax=Paenibacillus sonchi TaxID=373687 RepID=UPI001E333296|nr:immunity 42 family protein [Paenibacillus sonchi]MCE3199835.1 immunity 42 family protein [Paenibacillus sonchi]
MIFGEHSIFAVEFELDQEYNGVWLFGKFCYWVRGKRVGDYELGTSLRDVLFSLDTLVQDNGNRTQMELFGLSGSDLFTRLDGALFGYERTLYDEVAVKETWARFNVTLPIDIFDGCKVYLIDNLEMSRMLFRNLNEVEVQEEKFEKGLFDDVISRAHQELAILYKNTINNS